VTTAVRSAATFIAVLWTIGGAFTVHIRGTAITCIDGGVEKIAGFVGNVWGDEDPSDLAGNG
jgi:hypothetical protein